MFHLTKALVKRIFSYCTRSCWSYMASNSLGFKCLFCLPFSSIIPRFCLIVLTNSRILRTPLNFPFKDEFARLDPNLISTPLSERQLYVHWICQNQHRTHWIHQNQHRSHRIVRINRIATGFLRIATLIITINRIATALISTIFLVKFSYFVPAPNSLSKMNHFESHCTVRYP